MGEDHALQRGSAAAHCVCNPGRGRISIPPVMDRGLAVLLTALAGGLIALQPPINAELGRFTGNLQAGLVSFLVGTLLLAAIVVLSGKAGSLSISRASCWMMTVALAPATIFLARSSDASVWARSVLNVGTPLLS